MAAKQMTLVETLLAAKNKFMDLLKRKEIKA